MGSNAEMVRLLLMDGDADEAVAEAMLKVDRKDFLGEGKEFAYDYTTLPIGYGQTTSAPSIIAFMLRKLDVREGIKVIEVGTGSGYQTAILSLLAGEEGRVISVEMVPQIAERAKMNISNTSQGMWRYSTLTLQWDTQEGRRMT